MYLLDTNHCSYILQGQPSLIKKLSTLSYQQLSTCVIVQGELFFMAGKSAQPSQNLLLMSQFLGQLFIYQVDEKTAEIYGQLKASIIEIFGPKEKQKRRKVKIERLGFTDNDLWIAAIAKRYNLVIVSADTDFVRLRQVDSFQIANWLTE